MTLVVVCVANCPIAARAMSKCGKRGLYVNAYAYDEPRVAIMRAITTMADQHCDSQGDENSSQIDVDCWNHRRFIVADRRLETTINQKRGEI
jgi:hypothetical protein